MAAVSTLRGLYWLELLLPGHGPSAAGLLDLAKGRADRAGCLVAQTALAPHHWWGHLEESSVRMFGKVLVGDAQKSP